MKTDRRSGRGLSKADQGAETRAQLVAVATRLFGAQGYAGTSTERILEAAGVTRGALYHHFGDKADLMRAVCDALYAEVTRRIEERALAGRDAWSGLVAGCDAFLDVVADRAIVRVLFLDGPSVLGRKDWDAIERRHGFRSLMAGIAAAMDEGALARQPVEPLAVLLNGAMNEVVFWVAGLPRREPALRGARRAMRGLLQSLHTGAKHARRRTGTGARKGALR
jgi:AcrR family transcriptional regulator